MLRRFVASPKIAAMLACGAGLAACATASAPKPPIDEQLAARGLARTGETRSCLPLVPTGDSDALDEKHILFESGGRTYLNTLKGRCNQIDRSTTYFSYRTSLSSLCSNEVLQVYDNAGGRGMLIGSCGLGEFELLTDARR